MSITLDLPVALLLCAGLLCGLGVYAVRAWDRAQRLAASVDLTLGGAPDGTGDRLADAVAGGAVAAVTYGDDYDDEDAGDDGDALPPIGYAR